MTEGSGTSAQMTGLLASTNPATDEELMAIDELLDEKRLLDVFELELVAGNDELLEELNTELLDERIDETGVEETDVVQGVPVTTGISAIPVPLVP